MRAPGRNEPCSCGSGEKYKRCCAGKEAAANRPAPSSGRAAVHELDERVVEAIRRYADRRFGRGWLREAAEVFYDDPDFEFGPMDAQILVPWAVYHWPLEGRPLRAWFLEERGTKLTEAERAWLLAQRQVVLTVWEVLEVRAGEGLRVKDLLGSEEHFVHEVTASRVLRPREAVLGRVVPHEGTAVFCGLYPRPLRPREADEIVQAMRKRLRVRGGGPVPREKLALVEMELELIDAWRETAEWLEANAGRMPALRNTDGEPVVYVEDHYTFSPEVRSRVLEALAKLEGVEVEEDEKGVIHTFMKQGNAMHAEWENTVVGRADVAMDSLRLETNSVKRADALRRRVEAACEGLLTHRTRHEKTPEALRKEQAGKPLPPREPRSPEALAALHELKERHYAAWLDSGLPALKGKSPRQAVRTKAGRHAVEVILKELERTEAGFPVEERMDVSGLRRELGLEG